MSFIQNILKSQPSVIMAANSTTVRLELCSSCQKKKSHLSRELQEKTLTEREISPILRDSSRLSCSRFLCFSPSQKLRASSQINQRKESKRQKKKKKVYKCHMTCQEVPCFTLRRCSANKRENHIYPQ